MATTASADLPILEACPSKYSWPRGPIQIQIGCVTSPANVDIGVGAPKSGRFYIVESARHPDFFIVGAPKAGTTSLYRYLAQHPEIFLSPVKEPCYFASEVRSGAFEEEHSEFLERQTRDLYQFLAGPMSERRFGGIVTQWTDYLKLFRNAGAAKAVGEASVCYLWSASAARNIFAQIPDARIIMILRDPVERAFSQHLHARSLGVVKATFSEHLRAGLRQAGARFGTAHPFLELGLYSEQVARFRALFPADQIRIFEYEEYRTHPRDIQANICRFLGVDPAFVPDLSAKELEGHLTVPGVPRRLQRFVRPLVLRYRQPPRMTAEETELLRDYYREDTLKLSNMVDFDIRHWRSFPVQ